MATDTLRQVTGIFKEPDGDLIPNRPLKWSRKRRVVQAQGSSVILDEPFWVTTDASGAIDTEVVAGNYVVMVDLADARRSFNIVVPDKVGPHDIADILDGPVIDDATVTQIQALVDEAEAAEAAASTSAGAAASSATAAGNSATAAQAAQTGAEEAEAGAETARTQAELAATAAGAPIVTTLTDPVPADGTIELVTTGPGMQVWEVQSSAWVQVGWLSEIIYKTVAAALSDSRAFAAGTILRENTTGLRWEVAASGATDYHVSNGTALLYALPDARGAITARQIGITDGSDATAAFTQFNNGREAGIQRLILTKGVQINLASPGNGGFTRTNPLVLEAEDYGDIAHGDIATAIIGAMNLINNRATANGLSRYDALFDADKFFPLGINCQHDVEVTESDITGNGNGTAFFKSSGGSDFYADKCKADFISGMFADLSDHSRWRITNCWVGKPFYFLRLAGRSDYGVMDGVRGDAGYTDSVGTNNFGDYIKVLDSSTDGFGPRYCWVKNCRMTNQLRDGIDSTGGLHGWIIDNNYFDCATGALDAKQAPNSALKTNSLELNLHGFTFTNNTIRGGEVILTLNENLTDYGSTTADWFKARGITAANNTFFPRPGRENCGYYLKGTNGVSVTGDNFRAIRLSPAGDFDPSGGAFPASAVEGTYYTATGTATIDGLAITTGDFVVPKKDGAATDDSAEWVIKNTAWLSCSMLRFDGGEIDGYSDQGSWDASAGTFPTATNDGEYYTVSVVAGTVDDIAFAVGDFLVALVDSPSTTDYDGNWVKRESTFHPTPGRNISFKNIQWDARGTAGVVLHECERVSLDFAEWLTDHGETIQVSASARDIEITGKVDAYRNEFSPADAVEPIYLRTDGAVRIDLDAKYHNSDGRSHFLVCPPGNDPRLTLDGAFDGCLSAFRLQGPKTDVVVGTGRGLHVRNSFQVVARANDSQRITKGRLTTSNVTRIVSGETGLLGNLLALDPGDGGELTIASGAITATHAIQFIDTEADAATDDLTTINGGAMGDVLLIAAQDGTRTVVVKATGGNIVLLSDRALDEVGDTLVLRKHVDTKWHEVSFYSVA